MNELSTHIEYLLLRHQCVVVPHFGAFMTMPTASTRSDDENLFFPPMRMVRFNSSITTDDGLLDSSVAQTHGMNQNEARQRVQQAVFKLRSQLLTEGQVDFGSLGVFTQDEDGHIDFSACLAGALTPAFYGLDAFVMPRAERSRKAGVARAHRLNAIERINSDTHITINISRRALRRALSMAAVALLCLLVTYPLSDSTNGSTQRAAIIESHVTRPVAKPQATPQVVSAPTPSETHAVATSETSTEATPETSKVATSEAPVKESVAVPQQPAAIASEPAKVQEPATTPKHIVAVEPVDDPEPSADPAPRGFAIVLASATNRAGADDLVARMKRMGYSNARVYYNGRMNRVIIDGYATESAALDAKHKLQWRNDGFDDAWLLRP